MKFIFYKCCILFAIVFLMNCTSSSEDNIVQGMKAIYSNESNSKDIVSKAPKPFTSVGKIYKKGTLLFISDIGTGVHVIDNSNPANPVKIAFISIGGNQDVAVKDNILYADNANDLLAIDISDVNNVNVRKRLLNTYNYTTQNFPLDYFGYFECVDPEKGYVVDWINAELTNPECFK